MGTVNSTSYRNITVSQLCPAHQVAPGTRSATPAEGPYYWVDREPLRAGSMLPLFPLFKFYRVNPELVRNLMNTDPFEPDRKTAPVSCGSGALGWVGSNP